MERPLGNGLVLKANKVALNKADSQQQQQDNTGPSSAYHSQSARMVQTPHRSQEVHKLLGSRVGQLQQLYRADPVARVTFSKIAKSLDDKVIKLAEYQQQIQVLEAEVERLRPKKRKRVQVDLNERFASIADVIKAKKAAGKVQMPEEVANALVFEEMCFEWAISDPVVGDHGGEEDDLDSDS